MVLKLFYLELLLRMYAPDQTDLDSVTNGTNIVSITVTDTFNNAPVIETSSVDIPWEDISIYIDV